MQEIKLSPHFTLSEMTHTNTGLVNVPSAAEIANLQLLCVKVLEPLRYALGKPITVTSGFRCKAVNQKVGGVPTSHHVIGCAADIIVDGMSPVQVIDVLIGLAPTVRWTQAIREPSWLHVSYVPSDLKCECLRFDGHVYQPYK